MKQQIIGTTGHIDQREVTSQTVADRSDAVDDAFVQAVLRSLADIEQGRCTGLSEVRKRLGLS